MQKKGGRSLGEAISTTQAIKRGFKPETNAKKVSIAPKKYEICWLYCCILEQKWDIRNEGTICNKTRYFQYLQLLMVI